MYMKYHYYSEENNLDITISYEDVDKLINCYNKHENNKSRD